MGFRSRTAEPQRVRRRKDESLCALCSVQHHQTNEVALYRSELFHCVRVDPHGAQSSGKLSGALFGIFSALFRLLTGSLLLLCPLFGLGAGSLLLSTLDVQFS